MTNRIVWDSIKFSTANILKIEDKNKVAHKELQKLHKELKASKQENEKQDTEQDVATQKIISFFDTNFVDNDLEQE